MWATSVLAAPPGWDDYASWQAERLPQAGSVELVYCGIGNKSLAIVGYDYRTRASYKSFLDELYGVTSDLEFFEGLIGEARDDQHRSDRYINDLADEYVTDAFLEGMLDDPDACVAVRTLDGGGYEVEYELPNNRRMNLHPSNEAYLDRSREQGMIVRNHHKVYTIDTDGRLVSHATIVDGRRVNEHAYSYWKDAPPGFSIADHYGREGSGWVLVGARVSLEGEPERFTEGRIRELAAKIVKPGSVDSWEEVAQRAGHAQIIETRDAGLPTTSPPQPVITSTENEPPKKNLVDTRFLLAGLAVIGIGVVLIWKQSRTS